MDIVPYTILLGGSGLLILTGGIVIVIINFRRICGFCLKKESNIESVKNPVNNSVNNPVNNPVNEWK